MLFRIFKNSCFSKLVEYPISASFSNEDYEDTLLSVKIRAVEAVLSTIGVELLQFRLQLSSDSFVMDSTHPTAPIQVITILRAPRIYIYVYIYMYFCKPKNQ